MRLAIIILITTTLLSCKSGRDKDVWTQYEWLPADAEYNNPYLIPQGSNNGYTAPAYSGQPVYDNDSTYVPPRDYIPY